MAAERISEGVHFIEGRRFDSNSVLVIENGFAFLVDTGTGMLFSELANELARLGFPPPKISTIVNTHCHFDHTGGNRHFACPAHIHPADLQHLASGDEFTAAQMFGQPMPRSNPLPLSGEFHGWQVLHTPGHTEGSVCLLKDGVLISGDTMFADGDCGRTDLPGGNDAAMQHSLAMLAKLDYETLLPGHGPVERR